MFISFSETELLRTRPADAESVTKRVCFLHTCTKL